MGHGGVWLGKSAMEAPWYLWLRICQLSGSSFQQIIKGNRGNGNRGDIGVKFIGGEKSGVPREFGSGGGIDSGGEIVGF